MVVLGWPINNDCATLPLWYGFRPKLLRSFWANARSPGWRRLPSKIKLKLMNRTTSAVFQHGCALWPLTRNLCDLIRQKQTRLVSYLLQLKRGTDESVGHFCKRQSKLTKELIAVEKCNWTLVWARRSIRWFDHLQRDWQRQRALLDGKISIEDCTTNFSFAASLLSFNDSLWLSQQRSYQFRSRLHFQSASRTRTRSTSIVCTRFEDGVQIAKSLL